MAAYPLDGEDERMIGESYYAPDWVPLEAVMTADGGDLDRCSEYMYMESMVVDGEVMHAFKHRVTRRYLHVGWQPEEVIERAGLPDRVFSAGWYTFVGRWDADGGRFFDEASTDTAIAYTRGRDDQYYSYFFHRMVEDWELTGCDG